MLELESLKCSCFFSSNWLWVGQINNAKRTLIISSGRRVVSGSGSEALAGNTWPQATRNQKSYEGNDDKKK